MVLGVAQPAAAVAAAVRREELAETRRSVAAPAAVRRRAQRDGQALLQEDWEVGLARRLPWHSRTRGRHVINSAKAQIYEHGMSGQRQTVALHAQCSRKQMRTTRKRRVQRSAGRAPRRGAHSSAPAPGELVAGSSCCGPAARHATGSRAGPADCSGRAPAPRFASSTWCTRALRCTRPKLCPFARRRIAPRTLPTRCFGSLAPRLVRRQPSACSGGPRERTDTAVTCEVECLLASRVAQRACKGERGPARHSKSA